MKISNNRKVTINYLQHIDIADKKGVIDYKKYTDYKKKEQEKGYNIYLDKKDFKYKSEIDLIDNEPIDYNESKYKPKNDVIDWYTNKGDKSWINLNKNF